MKEKYKLIYAILAVYVIVAVLSFVGCGPPRGELSVTSPEIVEEADVLADYDAAETPEILPENESPSETQTDTEEEQTVAQTQAEPTATQTSDASENTQQAEEIANEVDSALDEVEELLDEIDAILALDLDE